MDMSAAMEARPDTFSIALRANRPRLNKRLPGRPVSCYGFPDEPALRRQRS